MGNSPYSIRGVGEVVSPALPHHIGMGGVGISLPQNFYLNNMNPALLPNNTVTNFSIGLMTDYRNISSENSRTSSLGGGLNYLAFSFPIITERWTLSSGIMPYSVVNYNFQANGIVPGTNTTVNYDYRGEGGISQAYISNGFQISKHLAAGFQVGYLFGSIINETGTEIRGEDIGAAYRSVLYDRTSFSDFSLKGGLAFYQKVRDRTFFNVGLIYELENNANAKHMLRMERRTVTNLPTSNIDTLVNNVAGSVRLPSTIGVGVSLFKTLKWSVASDVVYQNWSVFRDFNGTAAQLADRYRLGLGGEYTPNAASLDSYFSRITYRVGFNYENTPYQQNNEQVRDFGINFGMSLPVGRSSLDLALGLGQRGTTGNQLIKEDYFRVYLGVTFNDKWFVRRKFD